MCVICGKDSHETAKCPLKGKGARSRTPSVGSARAETAPKEQKAEPIPVKEMTISEQLDALAIETRSSDELRQIFDHVLDKVDPRWVDGPPVPVNIVNTVNEKSFHVLE